MWPFSVVAAEQAYRHWRRTRKSTPAKPPQSELPSYSTFAAEPETASSHGVEVRKQILLLPSGGGGRKP